MNQLKANADPIEQLMLLKELTKTTGILHDAQVMQLKMWSLVFAPHITASEMHVLIDQHEIDFLLKTKGRAPTDFQKRCAVLVGWVQQLLGGEWLVRIKVGGKLVHRGMRKIHERQARIDG